MKHEPFHGLLPGDALETAMRVKAPRRLRPRCGARTRLGQPCQARAVWDDELGRPRNGRCRLHGGLSTGPRTETGRKHIRQALRRRTRG